MNGRQLLLTGLGLLLFTAGAVLGLRPLPAPGSSGATIPFADPLAALAAGPGPAALALLVALIGIAVAVVGSWAARDVERTGGRRRLLRVGRR